MSKKVSVSLSWQWPHWSIIRKRKSVSSVRAMVCEVWQSSQEGKRCSVSISSGECTLSAKVSAMPWWQEPQVAETLSWCTLEASSAVGRWPWAVWQSEQVAVTTRPLSRSPLPWIEST